MTLQLLWLEYRAAHPNGYQYSWFYERYRAWRGQLDVVMRQIYRAGEKAFVDYGGPRVPVVDRSTGEVRYAMVFVGVLGASNHTLVDVTWSRALPDWTMSHVRIVRVLGRGARARDPGQNCSLPLFAAFLYTTALVGLVPRSRQRIPRLPGSQARWVGNFAEP